MEWNCGNDIAEIGWKKKLQLVCGNAIVEIGGKKKKLAIVTIPLSKMGRKKKSGFEIWGGVKKKNCYVNNIFTINHM